MWFPIVEPLRLGGVDWKVEVASAYFDFLAV
jgi:hypothetical protein